MFSKFSLKTKLLMISVSLATLVLAVGVLGWSTLRQVSSRYGHVVDVNLRNSQVVSDMRSEAADVNRIILRIALPGTSPEKVREYRTRLAEALKRYDQADAKYNEIDFVPGEQEVYDRMNGSWKKLSATILQAAELFESREPGARDRFWSTMHGEMSDLRGEYEASVNALLEFLAKDADTWVKAAGDASDLGNRLSLSLTAIGFFLALGLGYLFATTLSRTLTEIARRIGDGAEQVSSAAQQVAASSEELSSSATEQAASLEESVASAEELSAMVTRNSENASRSRETADRGQAEALKGKEVVGEMVRAIEDINRSNGEIMSQIDESNREISEIVRVISEIGNKTKVINDIVFQTKLLSFNASVEAARAGEHGKGFAVVAEEVGNLAQMSGNAAKEISSMLEESIQKVESIVEQTKTKVERLVSAGKEKVEVGTVVAKRCGEVLDSLVQSVGEINHMAEEISNSSKEQAQGVQEINKAMAQLDQVTQQNAAASQQASSAAGQMSSQAVVLRDTVEQLLRTVEGRGSATGAREALHEQSATEVLRRGAAKPHLGPSNVVALKRPEPKPHGASIGVRRVAGGGEIPSEGDPRFQDV